MAERVSVTLADGLREEPTDTDGVCERLRLAGRDCVIDLDCERVAVELRDGGGSEGVPLAVAPTLSVWDGESVCGARVALNDPDADGDPDCEADADDESDRLPDWDAPGARGESVAE